MKLLKREISSKNGDGFVTVIAEEPEDMWHIYNLIAPGDHLRASTYRKARTARLTAPQRAPKRRLLRVILALTLTMRSPGGARGDDWVDGLLAREDNADAGGEARAAAPVAAAAHIANRLPQIEAIHFDPSTCAARVKGKNVEENQYVRVRAPQRLRCSLPPPADQTRLSGVRGP